MNYSRYTKIIKDAQCFGSVLPCPRCGIDRMRTNLFHNAYSRNADIYICPACGMEEALEAKGVVKNKKQLKDWFIIRDLFNVVDTTTNKSGEYELIIKQTLIIYILSKAINDGISHWCYKVEPADGDLRGKTLSEQLTLDGSLKMYVVSEIEDEPEYYILTLTGLLRGIQHAINKGYTRNKYGDLCFLDNKIFADNICSSTADLIVQYALFDNTIYG